MNEERPGTTTAKAHRVQIQLEAGWQVAKQSLTPKLINPTELLTVGTFPMKPGGICAQLPSRAFEAIGENDAVITFQERGHRPLGAPQPSNSYESAELLDQYPPRPAHFRFKPLLVAFECAPADLDGQEFVFSNAGRRFYAYVVAGRKAASNEVESVLDSFEAQPDAN
jgi:hypothetical protein